MGNATTGGPVLPMVDRLIDVVAVAAMLDVSDRTVWKMHYAGKLPPCVRVNRSVKWRLSDIERFIRLGCDMAAFNAGQDRKPLAMAR